MKQSTATRRFIPQLSALFLAAAVLAGLASCGKIETVTTGPEGNAAEDPARNTFTVFGTITSNGKGVDGVQVVESGGLAATVSGASGEYRLGLPPGEHILDFVKEGHQAVSKPVSGAARAQMQLNVTMPVATAPPGGGDGGGGDSGGGFLAAPGQRLERRVSGPGVLEFDIRSVDDPNPEEKRNIAWGYEPGKSWTGGKGGPGAEWGLRTYKIKVFGVGGDFASEPRYSVDWVKSQTYHVRIEWDTDFVSANVAGSGVSVKTKLPREWVIGIGWPPAVREGVSGARYSNVVWPAGSKPLK